jgi:hypothetical protein
MESRFKKYADNNVSASNHIANIHSFIDYLNDVGNELIEDEIQDLSRRISDGGAPAIFSNKKKKLLKLGMAIEDVYETYHFNKDN